LGSSLPPTELARRDSGVFKQIKRLFSIAPKDEKGDEVAGVFLRNTRRMLVLGASDTDVSVWWLTLVHALLKEASDTMVLKRQTPGVSVY
jgi:hypothetical protein